MGGFIIGLTILTEYDITTFSCMKNFCNTLKRLSGSFSVKQPKLMLDVWGEEQIKKLKSLKQDVIVMQMSA